MATDTTITALRDAAEFWSVGLGGAAAVVRAACDVLAAGHGGTAMAMLAGVHVRRADEEAPEFLPDALAEVGLPYVPSGSAGVEHLLVIMAKGALTGALLPRELTAWAQYMIERGGLEAGQRLITLDDDYDNARDMLEYYGHSDVSVSELDAEVIAEARRIVERASSDGP